jgi:Protein of unknown function (DUF3592)
MESPKSFLSLAQKSFAFWFGGIWLFCGTPFLLIGLYQAIDTFHLQKRFKNEALVTEGMVLTKSITSHKNSRTYRVGYRFRAPDGTAVKNEVEVSGEFWDRVVERDPVTVTYLSSDPNTNRIDGAATGWTLALIFMGLGLFFVPVGGLIFFTGLSGIYHEFRLRQSGAVAEATVIGVAPAGVSFNGVPQWQIRYRYRDDKGQRHIGESGPMSAAEAEQWKAGDRATARFDSRAPHKSAWAGRI